MLSIQDVPAPAKLNLFLHIIGRRNDGYHLLQSVFMLIDWCDKLHFELRPDAVISREDLTTPLPDTDLIVRAAKALQEASGCRSGVHIGVEKHIPAQAGMGGGSSDAASTLLALNRLWKLKLSLSELSAIGLKLGADVPFFLFGNNAWVEGIGDRLTPITLPQRHFLVAKPDIGISTQAIFSHPGLKRDTETATISGFAAGQPGFGRNDLQAVAQEICPGVNQALVWLDSLGLEGRMTGSGSAVFAVSPSDLVVPAAPLGWHIRMCRSLEAHPLAGWASGDGVFGGQP